MASTNTWASSAAHQAAVTNAAKRGNNFKPYEPWNPSGTTAPYMSAAHQAAVTNAAKRGNNFQPYNPYNPSGTTAPDVSQLPPKSTGHRFNKDYLLSMQRQGGRSKRRTKYSKKRKTKRRRYSRRK